MGKGNPLYSTDRAVRGRRAGAGDFVASARFLYARFLYAIAKLVLELTSAVSGRLSVEVDSTVRLYCTNCMYERYYRYLQ